MAIQQLTEEQVQTWTREEKEKAPLEFDAEGRLLQDGKALPVRYENDPTTQRLVWKSGE
jgi:hypothetical protein